MIDRVGVGLIGSQFISAIHAESLQRLRPGQPAGSRLPTPGNAERLAERCSIPHALPTHRQLLDRADVDLIVIERPTICIARSRSTPPRPASMWSWRSRYASICTRPIGCSPPVVSASQS